MKTSYYLTLFFTLTSTASLWAQIPRTMSFQGVLTDMDGAVVADGIYDVTFRLYDAATDGTPLWEEEQSVSATNGIFNVILGSVVALDLSFDEPYWLGITVGEGNELVPRTPLTSSPYSLNTAGIRMDGVQSSAEVTIDSTLNTEILSFTVNDYRVFDITLNVYLVAEIRENGTGRYEFSLRRESINGNRVGRSWWRPGSSTGFQAITISFSGVEKNVFGPANYFLVGRKFDSESKDALVFISGINAIWTSR